MKARKRGRCGRGCRRAGGFNGAAPLKARKPDYVLWWDYNHQVLQWGRAVEGAETYAPGEPPHTASALQWGRAVEGAETR